jgi:hypothetical protein
MAASHLANVTRRVSGSMRTQRTPEPERSWGFAFHRRAPSDSPKGDAGYLVSSA